ncbi:hypothetical protein GCM10011579_029070 [Streptomyces albiflavescens]|uniref:Integrase catalytic domain-containing protein n=1 Tax=Streptomyces albiflavescens TaxID=1623582 RepID=A0A917Y250_9ACTN|nr:integrase core domain-containing protein [Streptomyces albiflavescens]GGN62184.1 hypothetical protein GCM10011579_029070 [Streptomyces albiflavescens]
MPQDDGECVSAGGNGVPVSSSDIVHTRLAASGSPAAGVRHIRYTDRLTDIGASASVGSVTDSYDDAMAEALNDTFKAELIEMQGPWKDVDQVERAIFQWVTWHNEERLHSALDYVPPAEYERNFWRSQEPALQSA